jgi:hypothetical protein
MKRPGRRSVDCGTLATKPSVSVAKTNSRTTSADHAAGRKKKKLMLSRWLCGSVHRTAGRDRLDVLRIGEATGRPSP